MGVCVGVSDCVSWKKNNIMKKRILTYASQDSFMLSLLPVFLSVSREYALRFDTIMLARCRQQQLTSCANI